MSVLKVAKIQGSSKTNYEITVPQLNKLNVLGILKVDTIRNTNGCQGGA